MKRTLFVGIMTVFLGLSIFPPGAVSTARAETKESPSHLDISKLELCIKNSGAVFAINEGFKKTDCTQNSKLVTVKGLPGLSAYEIALQQNPGIGTVEEWLISLKGEKGDKGDRGDVGPQGPIGLTGPQGVRGATGPRGPMGPAGIQGPQGEKGDKGDTGDQGPIGLTGPQGEPGKDGVNGTDGNVGPQGPKGDKGDQGDQGIQGLPGISGLQGYEIKVDSKRNNVSLKEVTVLCPFGKRIISGGYDVVMYNEASPLFYTSSSRPSDEQGAGWTAIVYKSGTYDWELKVYAVCVNID